MIRSFGEKGSEDVWKGENTATARKFPRELWKAIHRKLDMVGAAHELGDLRVPPGNRLEKLRGDLKDYHSIRVNDQYRIIFKCEQGAAHEVEIVDYHRG